MAPNHLIFVLLNAALFLEALVYGLIAPIVPYYARVTGADTSQLGAIFAVYSLALLFGSFPAGIACDRLGRRPVLLAGLLVLFISTLFFAWAKNLWLLLISRILQGAAGAAIWTAALAGATALVPRQERGSRLGLMMAVTGLGTIAGPIYSGFLLSSWGYQAPFFSTAVAVLIVSLGFIWLSLPEPVQEQEERLSPAGFFNALGDTRVALVMLLVVGVSFSFGMIELLLPLHLSREFNLDSRGIGVVFGVLSLSHSLIQPLWGSVSDRFGHWKIILAGLISTSSALPALSLVKQLPYLYLAGCFFGFASSAMITPCLPLLAEYSDQKDQEDYGKRFSLVNAAYAIGLLLGPAIGGVVTQFFSFPGATLIYSTLLLLLAVAIIKILRMR